MRFRINKPVLIILISCCLLWKGWGNNNSYYFKQIAIEHGLSQSSITSIVFDQKGMLWIGTRSGLNCYDQHELTSFFYEKDKEGSLPGNYILFVAEDSSNTIWVSTNKGIVKYDPGTNTFISVIPEKAYSYINIPGGILFSGDNVLYKYNYRESTFYKINLDPTIQQLSHDTYKLFKLLAFDDEKVLIATKNEGFFTYNFNNDEIKQLPFGNTPTLLSVCTSSSGDIYCSYFKKGLFCFNNAGELTAHYTTENSNLSNDIILDIVEKDGMIWVGTDGGGIGILNPATHEITTLQHIPGDASSLPVNSITILYNDKENNLWAGTVRGGIFGIKETYIRSYIDVALNNTNGLSEKAVISMYEDDSSMLWIGTDGGGINKYNPFTNEFTHYPATYGDKVASITGFSSTELLISLYSKGVFIVDKVTGRYRPFTIVNEEVHLEECFGGYMLLAHKMPDNRILILSQHGYLYNPLNKQFTPITTKEGDSFPGALNLQYAEDSVILLTKDNHIFTLSLETNELETLFAIEPHETIRSLCYDNEGTLWIGSDEGLSYYKLDEKILHRIETKMFNDVSYLFLDNTDRLWISAQNMLFSYIIKENRFVIWDESDGFSPNEILFMYQKPSITNNIYLAGINGLVKIDKNISYNAKTQPKVGLVDIIYNGSSSLNLLRQSDKTIEIPWNYTSLSIVMGLSEKDLFRQTLYRYSIAGLNNQYIESYNHKLDIPQLLPGRYSVMASCNTKSGNWSQPVRILTINVLSPWYQRSWFILLCVVTTLYVISGIVYTILRRNKNRLKWEKKEHEQTVNEEKIRFLVNISHELRTPLTLIYAPLKRLIQKDINKLDQEVVMEQLKAVYKQSRQMKNIINMVLDLNRLNSEYETLQMRPHILNQWIQTISEDFRNEFKERNIQLVFQLDDSIQMVWFDEWKCQIVLSNLLMNALKFSEPNTQIILSTQMNHGSVRISVCDEGIGLDNVDINKLFTRFYQGKHPENGSGIGLSYSKVLIEKHGGTIGAQSNKGKGATFYFELPLQTAINQSIYEKNELVNEKNMPTININESFFSCASLSILIVEDKEELRLFLRDTFKDIFGSVYTAEDGLDALEQIKSKQPDIIVSDVMMPRMDGYELCKHIKNTIEISHIPIILLTAKCDPDSTSFGYKLGADFYMPKPFDVDFLQNIIVNLLKTREAIRDKFKNTSSLISPQETTISSADERFMIKLNELIIKNLNSQELDVKFLMAEMAMSRASLYNKMKTLTGLGVNDYINKIRIEKAGELLIHTDMSIAEVAFETGFTYQRYFSTIFKEIKGVTPSQFKKENNST